VAQDEPDDGFLAREPFVHGVSQLAGFGFAYDLLIYPRQLPAAIELVRRLPNQRFVLDHLAKPQVREGLLQPWKTQISELARYPNVHCKLSGLVTEADPKNWKPTDFVPYLETVLEAFGPDRLLFGSDWPVCLLAGSYAEVHQLVHDFLKTRLAPDQLDAVFGLNCSRFYQRR
jgi:L-fuconolactonase